MCNDECGRLYVGYTTGKLGRRRNRGSGIKYGTSCAPRVVKLWTSGVVFWQIVRRHGIICKLHWPVRRTRCILKTTRRSNSGNDMERFWTKLRVVVEISPPSTTHFVDNFPTRSNPTSFRYHHANLCGHQCGAVPRQATKFVRSTGNHHNWSDPSCNTIQHRPSLFMNVELPPVPPTDPKMIQLRPRVNITSARERSRDFWSLGTFETETRPETMRYVTPFTWRLGIDFVDVGSKFKLWGRFGEEKF